MTEDVRSINEPHTTPISLDFDDICLPGLLLCRALLSNDWPSDLPYRF
jgi:hypothetical protein